MPQFLKRQWQLCLVLAVFIIAKLPWLHVAYYWDESWPYATAIKEMYKHGISLMPTAIDPELSRGHPLFFHAIAAGWMHVFGNSHVAMHSFALLISVLFLITIYETGLYFFNIRVAALALLLVVAQEMFFVQSSMVLFEMLVAFLCFLSIVLYIKEKYFLTALCLAMLFYTKESGLIAGFVIGLDALVTLFNKNVTWKARLYRVLAVGTPCILIAVHFILQKHYRGWYIFPLYAELAQHTWNIIWDDFRINCIRSEFTEYHKYYYFLLLIAVAMIAAIKQKQPRYLVMLLPAICIWYFVDNTRAGRLLPSVPFFIVFIASWCYCLYEYAKLFPEKSQKKLIVLFGLFVLCFLIFSAMNFFTPRYLLASIITMFFITAALFDAFFQRTWQWLIYLVVGCIAFIAVRAWMANDHFGDCDIDSIDGIGVHQEIVDYFEKNVPYSTPLSSGPFLEREHLSDPSTGYLHSDRSYPIVWEINDKTAYVIFDNIEPDPRYEGFSKQYPNFELVKRIERGKVWAEIYKRKI